MRDFSAICGAVGEYDLSTVRDMADSLRRDGQSLEIFEDQGIALAGVHESSESNIANDDHGEIHAAVAGDVFVRSHGTNKLGYGARAIANTWSTQRERISGLADGAFVSVVYDSRNSECHAFNDFVGQVPLFYSHFGGATYFASELRPFLHSKNIPALVDPQGLRLFFSFGCVPGRCSILGGVRKLFPASIVRITPNSVQERKYWSIGEVRIDRSRSLNQTVDDVESSLLTSIERRLVFASRPIGVLLGGLDSSVITALLRRLTNEKITAVTALFDDSRFNERGTRQVASENEVDLLEVPVSQEQVPKIIEDMAEAFDEPVSDMIASPIAFALIKKSGGVAKTFFDGTGADDLFQGIPHGLRRIDLGLNRLPSPVVSGLRKGMQSSHMHQGIKSHLARNVPGLVMSPLNGEVVSWQQMSNDLAGSLTTVQDVNKKKNEEIYKISTGEVVVPIVNEISRDIRGAKLDPQNITVKTAVSLYFGPTHGFDCSRNRALSSKYRVRTISPYYDKALYDIGLSVPWYYKMPSNGLSKPLLRSIAIQKGILPKDVALLKKKGLGSSRQSLVDTQMKAWMIGELSKWVSETIIESFAVVKHLLNKDETFRILRKGRPSQVFEILSFVLWYKKYFVDRQVTIRERLA